MGVPIDRVDGRYPHKADEVFKRVVKDIREKCETRIVVFLCRTA